MHHSLRRACAAGLAVASVAFIVSGPVDAVTKTTKKKAATTKKAVATKAGAVTTGAPATTAAPAPASTAAPTTAPKAVAVATDPNGDIRIGYPLGPRNMDPVGVNGTGDIPLLTPVYDRLIRYNVDGSLTPMLATSWNFNTDGSVLEMKLQPNVKFHDGTPFNAAAVKANIERGQTHPRSTLKAALSSIEGIDTPDELTVRFRVKKAQAAGLLYDFSFIAGMMVSPAAMNKPDLDQYGVGTGPYIIKPGTFSPNLRGTYIKAPGTYWGDAQLQRLASFEILAFPDEQARFSALRTGQIDVMTNITGSTIKQITDLAKGGNFTFNRVETGAVQGIRMNLKSASLSDLRVRQAINFGLNREAISQAAFQGACSPTTQMFAKGKPGYVAALDSLYKYDLVKAKQLLQEAGGKKITLSGASVAPFQNLANVVQGQLSAIGIDQDLPTLTSAAAIPAFRRGELESWSFTVASGIDPAVMLFNTVAGGIDSQGPTDKVLKAAVGMLDQLQDSASKTKFLEAVNRAAMEDAALIPICFAISGTVGRKGIVGLEEDPWVSQQVFSPVGYGVAAK